MLVSDVISVIKHSEYIVRNAIQLTFRTLIFQTATS